MQAPHDKKTEPLFSAFKEAESLYGLAFFLKCTTIFSYDHNCPWPTPEIYLISETLPKSTVSCAWKSNYQATFIFM
jgi:hypothetical protein